MYLRVRVFLCFVPAYMCFSTGSFDALVFVLLKVPELKKLVVANVVGDSTQSFERQQFRGSIQPQLPSSFSTF